MGIQDKQHVFLGTLAPTAMTGIHNVSPAQEAEDQAQPQPQLLPPQLLAAVEPLLLLAIPSQALLCMPIHTTHLRSQLWQSHLSLLPRQPLLQRWPRFQLSSGCKASNNPLYSSIDLTRIIGIPPLKYHPWQPTLGIFGA